MIAILGATGKVGGAAATELRRRGLTVRAVVRDAGKSAALAKAGCEIAVADLHDGDALKRALQGARGVLAIIPPSPKATDVLADAQGIIDAVAGALEATRPQTVVAISDYGAQHASGPGITTIFYRLEARLRATPGATTFLRSSEQMQNWMRQIRAARERGVLPSLHHPVTRPFPTVSAFDVGAVAADLLAKESEPPHPPRVIHVLIDVEAGAGEVRLGSTELADALR
jgi:uncharacterized protein YbjT (DUF2867 family)